MIQKKQCLYRSICHKKIPLRFLITLAWDEKREMLVGKIVAQQADDSVLTDGKIDLGKLQPIMFDATFHVYRVIGEVAGQAFKDGLEIKNK